MEKLVRLTEDYLTIIHKERKQNKLKMDIYEKWILASQVYLLILGLRHLAYAREKYEKNITDLSIWKNLFLCGMYFEAGGSFHKELFNELGTEFSRIKASKDQSEAYRWTRSKELKKEAADIARNQLLHGKKRSYKNIAEGIYESQKISYPEIRQSCEFMKEDFIPPYSIRDLCMAIGKDEYDLALKEPDNTIYRLNEILHATDFYEKVFGKHFKDDEENMPPDLRSTAADTERYRCDKYSLLDEEEQKKIEGLNRSLLELLYPGKVPPDLRKTSQRFTP